MAVKKAVTTLNEEDLDEKAIGMVERITVLKIATKHINLWIRQLEMKRRETIELAVLMELEEVKSEIQKKSPEKWARRCTHHFTKKTKRLLFEEIDNMVWCGTEKEISQWCKVNIMYDQITEDEIEEIWTRESPDDEEPVRLNGKYVCEVAKRVCDFINTHEDLITITTF